MEAKIGMFFYNNEGEKVFLVVKESDPVPPIGFKPAESYIDAAKRNYRAGAHRRFIGSVLLCGRS